MLKPANKEKIAVIGLGLIGGSLLKALRGKVGELIGVSRNPDTIKKVLKNGLADTASVDLSIVKDADIVFICTPINLVIQTIEKVSKIVSPECIITDAASLKGFILDHVNAGSDKINFIGGHLMAGTENKGIDSAVDGLFEQAKWVLTPSRFAAQADIDRLQKIIELTGAIPVFADAHEHDEAVALISHMPMVLSQALFNMANNYPDESVKNLAFTLASSGFRDMTRLACSNPEMANDMINLNRENIADALNLLESSIKYIEQNFNLENGDFAKNLENMIIARKKLYDENGKNTF